MKTDLTTAEIQRQNILNNPYAVQEIRNAIGIQTIEYNHEPVFLKEQVAAFFEVTTRTIENYLTKNEAELKRNGYAVFKGKTLKELKLLLQSAHVPEIDFGNIAKSPQLAVFSFRSFLNLAMLITESERAALLRQTILDIVIDTINQRSGGGTKYINQRDEDFIHAYFQEENYRKEFTDALQECVEMGTAKYPIYTNKIYVSIFRENALEYRKILRLCKKDKVRDTFYSEILDLVSSYEYGFAQELKSACEQKGRKLTVLETDTLFAGFESQPLWKPLVERARVKMVGRDLAFRDALHKQLAEYVTPLKAEEFERFLGEKSKELSERLEEAKDVFKRLKERE